MLPYHLLLIEANIISIAFAPSLFNCSVITRVHLIGRVPEPESRDAQWFCYDVLRTVGRASLVIILRDVARFTQLLARLVQ